MIEFREDAAFKLKLKINKCGFIPIIFSFEEGDDNYSEENDDDLS